jgi:hypothetical protein
MTRFVKSIVIGLVILTLCTTTAVAGGAMWYSLWWDVGWIPAPPLCRFVLPSRLADYDVIHAEMVFWVFTLSVAGGFLIIRFFKKRRTMRSTEPPPRA